MAVETFDSIKTQTLTSSTAGITFSDIPSGYTHLMLAVTAIATTGNTDIGVQLNGDSGSNYHFQMMYGNTSGGNGTYRTSTPTRMQITDWSYTDSSTFNNCVAYFLNYSDTNVWKTATGKSTRGNTGGGIDVYQNYWRNTNAISSMYIFGTTGNLNTGSTFSLYGLKAS